MRSFLFFFLIGCATVSTGCSNDNTNDKAPKHKLDASLVNNPHSLNDAKGGKVAGMKFTDTFFAFGKLHEGETASHEFSFVNDGDAPLLIANAAGSCGCTVPEYPHEPIAPGQSGIITVKFNSAGKTGAQNKSVNIFTNSRQGKHVLNITADVAQ